MCRTLWWWYTQLSLGHAFTLAWCPTDVASLLLRGFAELTLPPHLLFLLAIFAPPVIFYWGRAIARLLYFVLIN